jgi:Ca2+-binding RTX toxin-like protein
MPTLFQGTNSNTSISVNPGTDFILAPNVYVYGGVSNALGNGGGPGRFQILGTIMSEFTGLRTDGPAWIYIGNNASITAVAVSGRGMDTYGTTYIENHGNIYGEGIGIGYGDTGSVYTIINYGSISSANSALGGIGAGAASSQITNYGSMSGILIFGGTAGVDVFRNAGTINGQSISLGGGADTYDGTGGTFNGQVSGGDGNDTLTGGDFADSLSGGNNDDVLRGNGGIDTLDGGANNDTLFFSIEDAVVQGGSGSDTARNTYNDFGLTFDLGVNSIEFYFGSQAGETIVTSANIRMDVDAGGGNDLISGGAQGDGLSGGTGNDTIFGGLGPDQIGGGFGDDRIIGGIGADLIYGEQGNDVFVYNGVGDAGDTITDFEIGRDRIEILRSGFDFSLGIGTLAANRLVAGPANQAFGQFLLDTSTGNVFWDGDGTGAGTPTFLFQTQGVGGLNNTDFFVV